MNHLPPRTQTSGWVIDMASACSRLGTWGLGPDLRADRLAERAADLSEQLDDPLKNTPPAILGRAFRSLVADVIHRAESRNVSAIPLSMALLIVGAGTLLYSAAQPLPFYRVSLLLQGIGFLVLGVSGFRSPLEIRRFPSALGSLLIAAGSAISVAVIPFDERVSLFFYTAMAGLSLAALGFTLLGLGLIVKWDQAPRVFGVTLFAVAGLLAFSEIGWALYIADQSMIEFAAAVMVAAGSLLFIRFFARVRHLPIEGQTGV